MATSSEQDGAGAAPQINRQQFSLPELPTSSVTIYPARATVVRNIKGISLKPGRNEIIIHQLTPKADENSIKVSGRLVGGKVLLIADMTVDLVKPPAPGGVESENKQSEDKAVSWEPESDNDQDEEQPTVSDDETPTLKELSGKIETLKKSIRDHRDSIATANKQISYLERWGDTLTDKEPKTVSERASGDIFGYLTSYNILSTKYMSERDVHTDALEMEEKEMTKLKKKKEKLTARVLQKKVKAREERIRKKEEERERLREEGKEDKDTKAPEKWYRVRVWIDSELDGNWEGSNKIHGDAEGELELKYTVSDAGWASRYDIVISSAGESGSPTESSGTTSGKMTAHLTYHAHFQNRTYEMWKNALITLSTSQTVFTGLADGAPTLEPWRVQLASAMQLYITRHGHSFYVPNDSSSAAAMMKNRTHGGLYSHQEKIGIDKEKKEERKVVEPLQQQVYGGHRIDAARKSKKRAPFVSLMGGMSATSAGALSRRRSVSRGPMIGSLDEAAASDEGDDNDREESSESEDDAASMVETLTRTLTLSSVNQPSQPPIPKPNFVTQGLTSSYSIPHRMTIPSTHASSGDLETSSSAVRRHTILTMPLKQMQLSYACTPKLRAAAYLKARILNDSSTTLRKGLVGVTLDGTFIGSTPLPRTVYPGGIFNLPLGIDESVTVTYAKPSIKRNAQKTATGGGLFSGSIMSWAKGEQDMVATYGRSTVIRNNRLDRGAIQMVVCDQVPVSEDAKLVVTVTYPRGLRPPPPLLVPGTNRNPRAILEEPEMGEGDENGEEGSSMRMGQPVSTGTGVYVEGFSVVVVENENPEPHNPSPQKLPVPPGPVTSVSDDDGASSTGKFKRKSSLFSFEKAYTLGKSSRDSPHNPPQPPQSQPKKHANEQQTPFKWPPGTKEEKWGSAVAAMRRNGEVIWKVKLNPGMGVRLGLEYEARLPAGEGISGM